MLDNIISIVNVALIANTMLNVPSMKLRICYYSRKTPIKEEKSENSSDFVLAIAKSELSFAPSIKPEIVSIQEQDDEMDSATKIYE